MRQTPNDQIVHIESESREESIHSEMVKEVLGKSEATHYLLH
jgi:hypothetical protein